MPDALVRVDVIADRADPFLPTLVCSWTDGGPEAAWVHVAGELERATAPQLERTLRSPELQARLVVLDLRELAFIDASGVDAIVTASFRARKAGRRLILLRGPPTIDRMFTQTRSSDDVEIGDVDPVKPSVPTRPETELAS